MKQTLSLLILTSLTLSTVAPALAQQQETDDVVRISTKLVQIDAVVTDKSGNPIKDLTANDFEVFQDGKPQQIVSVSFVNTEAPPQPENVKQPTATSKPDKNAPLAPPMRTTPATAGRILTFVVDDGSCTASRVGMLATQEALQKFVTEQMRSDDLVAIYQTRSGSSMLQQYTSDKAQLLRVVKKVRWYPARGMCVNEGGGDFYDRAQVTGGTKFRANPVEFESDAERANRANTENRLRDNQVAGLVGVLRYITRGLQRVPGRKTVFLFSDGIPLMALDSTQRGAPNTSPLVTLRPGESGGAMRDLIDFANRASVVFNTIDVRGLQAPGASAADDFDNVVGRGGTGTQPTSRVAAIRDAATESLHSGMNYLADETGGRFYTNMNNLDLPVRRALALEKGYYLIGYQPEADTFKSKKFNSIEIKVKRPDVNVRARSGFLGITDEERRPKKRSGDSELYEAIVAPLPKAGLNVHLTAFFANTPSEGSFVRTMLHLDGEQLTFADEPNGVKKGVFDVIAVTLNEKNEVVDEFNRTHTIRFPDVHLDAVTRNGLIYTADIPVKKPGAYNFRVALRDGTSKQLGSAGQLIEVPDLKKSKFLLSGLSVGEVSLQNGKPVMPADEKPQNGFSPVASASHTAIRRFRSGSILGYSYKVYNAPIDKTSGQPKLRVQVRLYKDGELVTDGAPQAMQLETQSDLSRIADYGYLRLKEDSLPGDYALQVLITDSSTNKTASQWIDFEVVR